MTGVDWREALYERRFAAGTAYRERVWQHLYDGLLGRFVPPDGSVLDLGSGWGHFINRARAARRLALDANPGGAKRVAMGVEFIHQAGAAPWPLPDGSLDLVFSSNFLEHLPDKGQVEATISEARRCLRPGGRLVLMGPNARFLGGHYWDYWDHHVALTDGSVVELLEVCGFMVESVTPRFLPYTMSRRFKPPAFLAGLYLRLPFLWPVLGRQFLVVARNPGGNAGERQ